MKKMIFTMPCLTISLLMGMEQPTESRMPAIIPKKTQQKRVERLQKKMKAREQKYREKQDEYRQLVKDNIIDLYKVTKEGLNPLILVAEGRSIYFYKTPENSILVFGELYKKEPQGICPENVVSTIEQGPMLEAKAYLVPGAKKIFYGFKEKEDTIYFGNLLIAINPEKSKELYRQALTEHIASQKQEEK